MGSAKKILKDLPNNSVVHLRVGGRIENFIKGTNPDGSVKLTPARKV